MKNLHLLAISVGMAIGSAAMAEPSVTLYGIFDGGVSVSKLQHQSAKVQMTNGNWLSNRWGLMGQDANCSSSGIDFDAQRFAVGQCEFDIGHWRNAAVYDFIWPCHRRYDENHAELFRRKTNLFGA